MVATELNAVFELLEAKAKKPGVMSLAGVMMERKAREAIVGYFQKLSRAVEGSALSHLAASENKEIAVHAARAGAKKILRRNSHLLTAILEPLYAEAMLHADKQAVYHEAASDDPLDFVGLTAKEAAKYARDHAAEAVKGIDASTEDMLADAVAQAIEDQLSIDGLSRSLRELMGSMEKYRADTIARTEMADAFGFAALEKLKKNDIEYKELILSPDACEVCVGIADNGPVPTDEPFVDDEGEEYDSSPIHPNCRCATVGSRGPDEEAD